MVIFHSYVTVYQRVTRFQNFEPDFIAEKPCQMTWPAVLPLQCSMENPKRLSLGALVEALANVLGDLSELLMGFTLWLWLTVRHVFSMALIEIDSLPIKNGGIFHGELLNNQMVYNLIGDDITMDNCRAFNSRDGRVKWLFSGLDSSRAAG